MSAFGGKADIGDAVGMSAFEPIADIDPSPNGHKLSLLDPGDAL